MAVWRCFIEVLFSKFIIMFLLLVRVGFANVATRFPTETDVVRWATALDSNLQDSNQHIALVYSAYNKDIMPDLNIEFKEIDGEKLVSDMSKTLSEMMNKKMDALKKLVDAAEIAAAEYKWDKNLMARLVKFGD
ncbi:voltage-dependent calcium channel subunit alpha-2/delta-4-like [Physella acuta]|uniref:voltage-dependent calcium channel subunit alpha-2/delta-4-like n=1 Tax=Physella acuta TaxID=109671 RepID=UPI0027DAB707|nr:voltage-dependent calcium channel subunit alpha-2/delta-4-like [Physella acuta]